MTTGSSISVNALVLMPLMTDERKHLGSTSMIIVHRSAEFSGASRRHKVKAFECHDPVVR